MYYLLTNFISTVINITFFLRSWSYFLIRLTKGKTDDTMYFFLCFTLKSLKCLALLIMLVDRWLGTKLTHFSMYT